MTSLPSASRRRRPPDDGDVEVFAADEQDALPVDVDRWARLADHVLRDRGIRGDAELSLLFISEDDMVSLNTRFMGGDGATDVLAFPIDDDLVETGRFPDAGTAGPDRSGPEPADAPLLLGDVVICPAVASANAPDHAGSYDDELALLVVHGVLHVLGFDHAEPGERETMQACERRLLSRHHGPLTRDPWSIRP